MNVLVSHAPPVAQHRLIRITNADYTFTKTFTTIGSPSLVIKQRIGVA
jgi:hypothetical protein